MIKGGRDEHAHGSSCVSILGEFDVKLKVVLLLTEIIYLFNYYILMTFSFKQCFNVVSQSDHKGEPLFVDMLIMFRHFTLLLL